MFFCHDILLYLSHIFDYYNNNLAVKVSNLLEKPLVIKKSRISGFSTV
ncbi:hypothetical protein SPHINGO8BC_80072 [Sphingobacterium multivorum]|uniref:Uncharacterized protein n=1 Tax=Sphingobacterium multivorum TaxID=28454 RepID=A0A654DN21_SPHMU|nr:hypothetical protein SPHINGO8BC_80072 [Sphingobacterium multivorum]